VLTLPRPAIVFVRWMIARDMPAVLRIEREAFEYPWSEDDFAHCMLRRSTIGMVAESEAETVVAYLLYELHGKQIDLLNLAVAAPLRRHGIGSQLVAQVLPKLSRGRRSRLVVHVRERNLAAQLFFRSQGFLATDVLRGYYQETALYEGAAEDAYRLVWSA